MNKLISGIDRFQKSVYKERRKLFAELAGSQRPEVLFITCADSRIDPNLITQTQPGDLFVCRNAGNIVPPHGQARNGISASIEYAVVVLGVKDIVVCGHTDCGAMKGALNPSVLEGLPDVSGWLEHARAAVEIVREATGRATIEELQSVTEQNVLLQLAHLGTYPAVVAKLVNKKIRLHGWVYHIDSGCVRAHDEARHSFVSTQERYAASPAS